MCCAYLVIENVRVDSSSAFDSDQYCTLYQFEQQSDFDWWSKYQNGQIHFGVTSTCKAIFYREISIMSQEKKNWRGNCVSLNPIGDILNFGFSLKKINK